MHMNLKKTGFPALARKGGRLVFVDPEWDNRLNALIYLTSRTSVINELTGGSLGEERIKQHMDLMYEETGYKTVRPRGKPQEITGARFLNTRHQRADASFLMRLHFGSLVPTGRAEQLSHLHAHEDINLGRQVDWLCEVYNMYRSILYPEAQPLINFESYYMAVKGTREGLINFDTCRACASRYIVVPLSKSDACGCPFCEVLNLGALHSKQSSVGFEGESERLVANSSRMHTR